MLINKKEAKPNSSQAKDPVSRYLFEEEKGHVIHDSGSVLNPINLLLPKYKRYKKEPFFSFSFDSLQGKSGFSDLIINIFIFIPLGIFIHGMLRTHFWMTMKISLATYSVEPYSHKGLNRYSIFL